VLGYSPIGCTQQYVYEYFSNESRFLKTSADELKIQALSNITDLTKKRILWTAPSPEIFSNEEIKIIKSQAYSWASSLFYKFSWGENPHEDKISIDFNEVFEQSDVLPKISGLLMLFREDLEKDVFKFMKTELAKGITNEPEGDVTKLLKDIRLTLAKISILKDYENTLNSLYSHAVRGRGVSIPDNETKTNIPPDAGFRIV